VTFSAGVLQEVKEENNSSQEDKHIQEGSVQRIGFRGTMQGKCMEAERRG